MGSVGRSALHDLAHGSPSIDAPGVDPLEAPHLMQDLFLALDGLMRKASGAPLDRPSASRVAYRVFLARSDAAMDRLARLSFLEGVAAGNLGVSLKPGKWVMKGNSGWKEAEKHFKNLAPEWTSKSNQGFWDAAVSGVEAVLGRGATGDNQAMRMFGNTIESIVSDHMLGMQPYSGAAIKPVFYEVGLTLLSPREVEGIQEGEVTPATSGIKGAIRNKFKARTKSLISMYKRREKSLGKRVDPTRSDSRPIPDMGSGNVLNPLLKELRKRNSPVADRIRELLKEMVRRKMRKSTSEVWDAYLDFIKGQAFGATAQGSILPQAWAKDLAKITGKKESAVRMAVKRAQEWLVKNAQKSPLFPKLEKLVSKIEGVGQLGYAGRTANSVDVGEIFADWLELEGCACEGDGEVIGETTKTYDAGPFEVQTVKYPSAPRGGYRFS